MPYILLRGDPLPVPPEGRTQNFHQWGAYGNKKNELKFNYLNLVFEEKNTHENQIIRFLEGVRQIDKNMSIEQTREGTGTRKGDNDKER